MSLPYAVINVAVALPHPLLPGLQGWVLRQLRPPGPRDPAAAVPLDDLTGDMRPMALRVPPPPGDVRLPLATRLLPLIGVAHAAAQPDDPPPFVYFHGTYEQPAPDAWVDALDGVPPALLRWEAQPDRHFLQIRLDPRVLRWPAAAAQIDAWLLLLRCAFAPQTLTCSTSIQDVTPRTQALGPQDYSSALAVLGREARLLAFGRVERGAPTPKRVAQALALSKMIPEILGGSGSFRAEGAEHDERRRLCSLGHADAMYAATGSGSYARTAVAEALDQRSMVYPLRTWTHSLNLWGDDTWKLFDQTWRTYFPEPQDVEISECAGGDPKVTPQQVQNAWPGRGYIVRQKLSTQSRLPVFIDSICGDANTSVTGPLENVLTYFQEVVPTLPLLGASLTHIGGDDGDTYAPFPYPTLLPDCHLPTYAFLLKGAGHDRVLSRRLLEHGPWQVTHPTPDTTLVTMLPATLNTHEATVQARVGRDWLRDALTPLKPAIPPEVTTSYNPAQRALVLHLSHPPLLSDLNHAVAVARARRADTNQPVDRIIARFSDPALAQAWLPALWLREIEVYVREGRDLRRLDDTYTPPDLRPDWARTS